VVRPHKDLGRAGPVCPFVPGALERKTLWLAPEQIADRDVPDVVQLINGYKSLFLDPQPTDVDDANYKVTVVVFTNLSADRAQSVFDDLLQHLAVPLYVEDGIVRRLEIEPAIVAAFDSGARTADVVAALWPERCGYLIGSQAAGKLPLPPGGRASVVVPVLLRDRARPGRF
jgi:hypothetical protein